MALFKEETRSTKLEQAISFLSSQQPYAQLSEKLSFDPPAYKQRYGMVCSILELEIWKGQIRKVVDFGCSEMNLFPFLKHSSCPPVELLFIDIDEDTLQSNVGKVQPLIVDYVSPRDRPFNVSVYRGSVCEPDERLKDVDAVIAIELIEHLYPDILDALPFNIFHVIHPKVVVFTTPNADFNPIIPNFKGFRHPDHKFEWSREQFEEWSHNICQRFPLYSVHFCGVAPGPRNLPLHGCCSQMAVFIRMTEHRLHNFELERSFGVCTYGSNSVSPSSLTLLNSVEYPYELDTRNNETKLLDDVKHKVESLRYNSGFYVYDRDRIEINISFLRYSVTLKEYIPDEHLINILRRLNYVVEKCSIPEHDEQFEWCVVLTSTPSEVSDDNIEDDLSNQDSDIVPWEPVISTVEAEIW